MQIIKYCTDNQDFRTFTINRIVEFELLDKAFIPADFPENIRREIKKKVYE
jgi:predicted DNA-binding transcriptional regulator YafY